MARMTNAIEVRALRKTFGRTTALDGLDLAVRSGEVHAFLEFATKELSRVLSRWQEYQAGRTPGPA